MSAAPIAGHPGGHVAAFVDRDGVINELVPDPLSARPESPLRPADVRLIDGAAGALRRLADAGLTLVGVSNQPAAAKGTATPAALAAVQARVLELLAAEGVHFADFRICPHHPAGTDPVLGIACACRKPEPGMLLEAAAALGIDLVRSWMVGDTDTDVLAGQRAGCHTLLVGHRSSAHKRSGMLVPEAEAGDLYGAAGIVLSRIRGAADG